MNSGAASSLVVSSHNFAEGGTLPMSTVFSGMGCTGHNRSPHLTWSGEPDETKSFALTLYDPDAPTGTGFYHWVLFNIPADCHQLEENAGASGSIGKPEDAVMSHTDFGSREYSGPCPPPGDPPHRYIFTVYALSVPSIPADAATTGAKLSFMMRESLLAKGSLSGRYGR
ncbi:MAG: YbhB/YbcL family Raf kinase inhibitor-like protein [Candidatus Eremiobacteraeota bacterium]|nr:YbhB/YbcL family Raf kinase inhibitor-like protein [Candidatus Eremiobacteraeota bacterium]MBC5827120.1 YbhB/YbcL family Raf kinase inhibitor-like protein [Candidatus Eremiobacteraeota bacterium]